MQTRLTRFAACVLTGSIAAFLTGCTEPNSQPSVSPHFVSRPKQNRFAHPIRGGAEPSPSRAGCCPILACDRPPVGRHGLRFDGAHDGFAGSVAAQWARNINQARYNRVRSTGNAVVRDAVAKRSKKQTSFESPPVLT